MECQYCGKGEDGDHSLCTIAAQGRKKTPAAEALEEVLAMVSAYKELSGMDRLEGRMDASNLARKFVEANAAVLRAALAQPQAGEVEECARRLLACAEQLRADSQFRLRMNEKITPFGAGEIVNVADLMCDATRLLRATQSNGHSPLPQGNQVQSSDAEVTPRRTETAAGESPAQPALANVLRNVSSEWRTERNDAAVTVHYRMVDGVLCRWWGDGPTPPGVAKIDAACSAAPAPSNSPWIGCCECDVKFSCYEGRTRCIRLDPPTPSAPVQEPIGRVERYTGDLHDMSVIIWLGEQPPEGTLLYAAPSAPAQEPTITVSGPVACGKSYVMELIYKALRNAGLHPYSDELAHERRMVEEQPQPAAKVWRLRESVYAAPPQAAPTQEPVAWRYQWNGRWYLIDKPEQRTWAASVEGCEAFPLYTAPPQDEARELLREVVDHVFGCGSAVKRIRAFLEGKK